MKHLNSAEILRLLEPLSESELADVKDYFEQTGRLHPRHGYLRKRHLKREAPVKELLAALQQTDSTHIRMVLCDMLGELGARSAAPAVMECLNDPSPDVRSSAADALGKMGSPRAGETLMRLFQTEQAPGVRRMIAAVLGAVGHQPAIPLLIEALSEADRGMRGSAAWALGKLRAVEAKDVLERALRQESELYPIQKMAEALEKIEDNSSGEEPPDEHNAAEPQPKRNG